MNAVEMRITSCVEFCVWNQLPKFMREEIAEALRHPPQPLLPVAVAENKKNPEKKEQESMAMKGHGNVLDVDDADDEMMDVVVICTGTLQHT